MLALSVVPSVPSFRQPTQFSLSCIPTASPWPSLKPLTNTCYSPCQGPTALALATQFWSCEWQIERRLCKRAAAHAGRSSNLRITAFSGIARLSYNVRFCFFPSKTLKARNVRLQLFETLEDFGNRGIQSNRQSCDLEVIIIDQLPNYRYGFEI